MRAYFRGNANKDIRGRVSPTSEVDHTSVHIKAPCSVDCDPIHQPPPTVPDSDPEKVCSGHLRVTRKNPKTLFKALFDFRCGTKLRLHPITTLREPRLECGALL